MKLKQVFTLLTLAVWGCSPNEKFDLTLKEASSQNAYYDEKYFLSSISDFKGICKFAEIKGESLIIYKFELKLDTSGNRIIPAKLFYPDSTYVADRTKFPKGEVAKPEDLAVKMGFVKAGEQYENLAVNEAIRNGTYPFLIKGPYFDSRTPKFSADVHFSFIDEDGIELFETGSQNETLVDTSSSMDVVHGDYLFQTLKPASFEGKRSLNFKTLKAFKKDILEKTEKVEIVFKNIHVDKGSM